MATLRYIANDPYTILRQNYDDSKITLNHVIYWVMVVAERLKSQHIEKRDTGQFLSTFESISVQKDQDTKRKYIELPTGVLSMNLDKGINYISYDYNVDTCTPGFSSVTFKRTTQAKSKILYWNDDEKPSPSNPYFYRDKDRVYFLGIECIDVNSVEAGLYSTFDPSLTDCDIDEEFNFPQELIPVLQRQVLDLGRFALLIPREAINDGTNDSGDVPRTKIVSVNEAAAPNPNQ